MSYNNILKILFILAIISTLCICIIKPKMHTTMLIYDSNYKIETPLEQESNTVNMPTMIQSPQSEKKETKETQNTIKQVNNTKKTESKNIQNKQTNKTSTKTKVQQNSHKKAFNQKISQEEIAWNQWRSRLQNQIMNDTTLPPIPQGTIFKFTFDVDLYGRIYNLQTWAIPSIFTPYAIQYIAPVIKSYQGHSILTFPTGTARTTTNVKGGWKIATQAKYSTPQDYNDTEKIVK